MGSIELEGGDGGWRSALSQDKRVEEWGGFCCGLSVYGLLGLSVALRGRRAVMPTCLLGSYFGEYGRRCLGWSIGD